MIDDEQDYPEVRFNLPIYVFPEHLEATQTALHGHHFCAESMVSNSISGIQDVKSLGPAEWECVSTPSAMGMMQF